MLVQPVIAAVRAAAVISAGPRCANVGAVASLALALAVVPDRARHYSSLNPMKASSIPLPYISHLPDGR